MPDGPESIGEVARLIKQLEQHIDRRFNSIEQRQDKLVSIELYDTDRRHVDRRFEQLAQAIADERQARVEDVADEAKEREKAAAGNLERIKNLGAAARWSVTASVAILGVFLTILFRGTGG